MGHIALDMIQMISWCKLTSLKIARMNMLHQKDMKDQKTLKDQKSNLNSISLL